MVFDKVRFFSTINKDTDTFVLRSLFEKQRWINSLILDFSSICGMMVYKVIYQIKNVKGVKMDKIACREPMN
jgi:hypothetical protein